MRTGIKNRISFTKSILLQLSIIIVNYNVKYFLEQCLCSVLNACKNIEAEIFVVDNQSADGSEDFFKGRFSNVNFIWNKENVGFSKANNLGLKRAVGKYILFLNPDTILPEDCLEKCLAFFREDQNIGAMGVRMIDGSGLFLKESKRGFPSSLTALYKLSGLTALFPNSKIFGRYYLVHLDQHSNHEVDVLAGAFMLVKNAVLETTGGFDERFFMYGEDVDLSYRIQKAGFKNIYFAETTIIHFKGESTKKESLHYVRLFYGAMSLFVKKHYSSTTAMFYSLLINVAIRTKGLFSSTEKIRNKESGKKTPTLFTKCLIVGDKKDVDSIKSILQKNNLDQAVIGSINPNQSLQADTVKHLSMQVNKDQPKELIFCVNEFAAKDMIQLLEQLPAGINYKIHFAGTHSIVGSMNKETTGDYITEC